MRDGGTQTAQPFLLFDALDRLFFAWDSSVEDLGPEWIQMGEMIDAVRAATPEHKTSYERLIQIVARVTRNA